MLYRGYNITPHENGGFEIEYCPAELRFASVGEARRWVDHICAYNDCL